MVDPNREASWILWFSELSLGDLPYVGGKNASLGELRRGLASSGVAVPSGFATTASAYRTFLEQTGLGSKIETMLSGLDTQNIEDLQRRGRAVRAAVLDTELPETLCKEVVEAYRTLSAECPDAHGAMDVAVRSSATAEDLPDASFAGQQESYLNVVGDTALLQSIHRCYASLFTDRAISYRADRGFSHEAIAISVGVQRMVRSDLSSSGVMFTIDTESGFRNAVLINSAYGLGEAIVQGSVTPDEFVVFKGTLGQGPPGDPYRPIVSKKLGSKEFRLVYDEGGGRMVRPEPVDNSERVKFSLSDDEILQLAVWGCAIERHYSTHHDRPTPMDIEWAKDGRTGELFIVQARPETVHSRRSSQTLEVFELKERGPVLVSGRAVGDRIGRGRVRILDGVDDLHTFEEGEVLVAQRTDPDWEPTMKKASAIVTDQGGRTCHAAIVSRELGVPAVVGAGNATAELANGRAVTVSCAEGETGLVFAGLLDYEVKELTLDSTQSPRTKVQMNVANPDLAFRLSMIPNDGVGLLREEFVVANHIGIHPMALLEPERVSDPAVRREIFAQTDGYSDKAEYFIDRLSQGVGMIAAAFHPNDVILRLSDFKTNEYAKLLGGESFEPVESNPMIGFRGASRYYDDRYRPAFGLECQAIHRVRETMGLSNLKVMVPFCRTPAEGGRVLDVMAEEGLQRGENGLEVYVMCEIPANVICAEEFCEIFDGFSIGSNDLTQLILGVDRDSEVIAHLFDERETSVMRAIGDVIDRVRAKGRKIGICGQAPSDYPEFAEFLVEHGIDSISLNPDVVLSMRQRIVSAEARQGQRSDRNPSAKHPSARTIS